MGVEGAEVAAGAGHRRPAEAAAARGAQAATAMTSRTLMRLTPFAGECLPCATREFLCLVIFAVWNERYAGSTSLSTLMGLSLRWLQDARQPAQQNADRAPLRCAALGCCPPGCWRSVACQLRGQRPSLLQRARCSHKSGNLRFQPSSLRSKSFVKNMPGHEDGEDLRTQAVVSALNTVVLGLLLPPQHKQVIRLTTVQDGGLRAGLTALPAHIFASSPS